MDTSEIYIKMCQKATEIQELYKDDECSFTIAVGKGFPIFKSIWLPRQDQLQEMLGDFEHCIDLIDRWEECDSLGYSYIYKEKLASMEQMWLSIVMQEKHNKTWNGEEWANGAN